MKKFSVVLSLILCFCLSLTAFATELPGETTTQPGETTTQPAEIATQPEETTIAAEETTTVPEETTEAPEIRYLGDVDGNGSVTADDARKILRNSVGLESIEGISLLYCDADGNGVIAAADARLALRTAVELEEKQGRAFEIIDEQEVSCAEEGYISGKCAVTGKENKIILNKQPHTLKKEAYCKGTGICEKCKNTITVEIKHCFEIYYQEGARKCVNCGIKEPFTHHHSFKNGNVCECGDYAIKIFEYELREYLQKNGEKADGCYYITDYVEPMSFALIYDESLGFAYAYCGFAVDVNGTIIYYDFNYDLVGATVEAILYAEDTAVAYAYGRVEAQWVNEAAEGDAIILEEYDVIPDLKGYENMFRQMMEGAVNDMILWMKLFAEKMGCTYTEHIFADFVNVK